MESPVEEQRQSIAQQMSQSLASCPTTCLQTHGGFCRGHCSAHVHARHAAPERLHRLLW